MKCTRCQTPLEPADERWTGGMVLCDPCDRLWHQFHDPIIKRLAEQDALPKDVSLV